MKSVCASFLTFVDVKTIFRYPIYHIPMGRTIKDLSTCFLTYHTLSSSFQGIYIYICIMCVCFLSTEFISLKYILFSKI